MIKGAGHTSVFMMHAIMSTQRSKPAVLKTGLCPRTLQIVQKNVTFAYTKFGADVDPDDKRIPQHLADDKSIAKTKVIVTDGAELIVDL